MKRLRSLTFTPFRAALVLSLISALGTTVAAAEVAAVPPGPLVLVVQYVDNFEGVTSLYAVRGCAESLPALSIVEIPASVEEAGGVLARLVNAHGQEISRHAGASAICAYARYAVESARIHRIAADITQVGRMPAPQAITLTEP